MNTAALNHRNRRVGLVFLGFAGAMLGLGFASVPLYRIFCQVTGFNGTTQRVSAAEASRVTAAGKMISVRFDGNVAPDVPWSFQPEHSTDTIELGQRDLAFFVARNNSDKPVTGTATFNVEPEQTGQYFNKIQCFCFTEQTLQPGEEVRMPVLFYVDPKMLDDENAKDVEQITLSYTFHKAEDSPS
ncbi:cytochrome c oxidase assembly protein [Croceicoccus estronivorus]|uniref:cytochrome c oxidase assembly protein n=1 Tax=Croceicoccus estronivorus TaxID=1172626 RepID=UPI00083511B9|nr:cytochrome c oxidase assembly protein [Croceicoccus estronivorus]OCC24978.1 cytochrome c oxidase assembly protein [Croceicoccus estronivorus]